MPAEHSGSPSGRQTECPFVRAGRLWHNQHGHGTTTMPMLLQTNSYLVPADRREEHDLLMRRFRRVLTRLGCDQFDVYEQSAPDWPAGGGTGRFVQMLRFRDRDHQLRVQAAERADREAQALVAEFCAIIDLPGQQQRGAYAAGFYQLVDAGDQGAASTDNVTRPEVSA
jgi:hypothetical protein